MKERAEAVVPPHVQFYVRGGLQRALHATLESIKAARKSADEIEKGSSEAPKIFADQLRGVAGYQQQWLGEALRYFEELPDEIRPDLSHYEGIKPFGPLPGEEMTLEEIDKEIALLQALRRQREGNQKEGRS